jgi:hypothetical protein
VTKLLRRLTIRQEVGFQAKVFDGSQGFVESVGWLDKGHSETSAAALCGPILWLKYLSRLVFKAHQCPDRVCGIANRRQLGTLEKSLKSSSYSDI